MPNSLRNRIARWIAPATPAPVAPAPVQSATPAPAPVRLPRAAMRDAIPAGIAYGTHTEIDDRPVWGILSNISGAAAPSKYLPDAGAVWKVRNVAFAATLAAQVESEMLPDGFLYTPFETSVDPQHPDLIRLIDAMREVAREALHRSYRPTGIDPGEIANIMDREAWH